MSLGVTTSMKQMCVQQTLKARFIVHQAQESWQHVAHQKIMPLFIILGPDFQKS